MSAHGGIPDAIAADVATGERLAWWTLAWIGRVVIVLALVMGQSQAMKSAVIEDVLSLIPAIVFLLSVHWERKAPNGRFPFGYRRAKQAVPYQTLTLPTKSSAVAAARNATLMARRYTTGKRPARSFPLQRTDSRHHTTGSITRATTHQ